MRLEEHEEQQNNLKKRVTIFGDEVVRLTNQLQKNLSGIAAAAAEEAAENLEWKAWAKTTLYGERYWENVGCNVGVASDLRSWITYRFKEMERVHAERVSQLEAELVQVKLALQSLSVTR